jgi:uncharacterized membrane protein
MRRWILFSLVGVLIVAVILHIVTLFIIPLNIMNNTMSKYPVNKLVKSPKTTAQSRNVVRPSPDLVYSICCYDVSKEPIRFTAKIPTDTYWSVSMYQENSDNFFVLNDRQAKSNPVEIVLVKQGNPVPSDAGNAQIVYSPTSRGILLVRHLLLSEDRYPDLQAIQKQSSVKIGSAPIAVTPVQTGGLPFEPAEYKNSVYGFSIKYPKEWKEAPPSGNQLFVAAAPARVPTISISSRDETSFSDAINNALKNAGNTEINIGPRKSVQLKDGTEAVQSTLKFKVKSGYDAEALSMGVQKDGKWIITIVTTVTMAAPYDESLFSAIMDTFQLNK